MVDKKSDRKFGKSIAIPSHSWKNDGGVIEGTILKVVRFIGKEFEGDEDKIQLRMLLALDSGDQKFVYMPPRWLDTVPQYTGAYVRITSSQPGKTTTRYDLLPEEGFKPKPVMEIETVRHDGSAEPF